MAPTRRRARPQAPGRAGQPVGRRSVREVNAGDRGLREEVVLPHGGRGLGERPAGPAAQVQPGSGNATCDGRPENAEPFEPELAGITVDPGKLPLPVHRAVRDTRRRMTILITGQLPARDVSSISRQAASAVPVTRRCRQPSIMDVLRERARICPSIQ